MTSFKTRDETYLSALAASAAILADGYRTADQLHADVIDGAHETLKRSRRDLADLAERDRAYGNASDARAYLYAEAEQRHQDRLAALALHFGQFYRGPGNPAADHAQAFVASIDPAGDDEYAAPPLPEPVGTPAVVTFGGSRHERRVDERGRVVPEQLQQPDPERGTFTGSPAEFAAAKARGVMTPTELAGGAAATLGFPERPDDDRLCRSDRAGNLHVGNAVAAVEPPAPAAEAIPRPPSPPAGLLADIAATLARTAR